MGHNLPSVKIIEICKVAPPPPHTAAPTSLPLTYFDLLWLRFHPIQRLFFYELPSNDVSFVDAVVPKLKTSLSLALRHYLPLAGNLLWPECSDVPTVEFVDGDGVSLTVAESDADFYHLSSNGFREVSGFHPLVPHLPASHRRVAVIALQVTKFQNRGFSIGIANHHAIIDGRSSTSFIKSWAQICIGESSSIIPLYDRSVIDDPKGLAKMFANMWMNIEGPNNRSLNLKIPKAQPALIRSTFEFTHQNIQNLKQWIILKNNNKNDNDNDDSRSHISSFALATAYLCVCTAKLEGLRDGKLWFGFAADARSRLQPPVPSNYLGNCLDGGYVGMERIELLGENGIVVACEAISKAIKNLSLGEEVLKVAEQWGSFMSKTTSDIFIAQGISIAGSPRFEVYSVDFGWGKPIKVEVVSAESPLVFSLTDCRKSDVGMEIGVVRERNEMESFAAIFHQGFESLHNLKID